MILWNSYCGRNEFLLGILLTTAFGGWSFLGCNLKNSVKNSPVIKGENVQFIKQVVFDQFISEGVGIGDVNRDGTLDIISGPFWFEGPDWRPHEIYTPQVFDYAAEWSNSFLNFVMDVDHDGWLDYIRIGFPGKEVVWYQNPGDIEGHWKSYLIDSSACNESPMLADVDDNGRMDLVFGHHHDGRMMWFRSPDPGGELDWEAIPISENNAPGTEVYSHGLGFGDVNADGRGDIITRKGWWEAPEKRRNTPWQFHPADLGLPCAQMYAVDLDRDGDNDIVSSSAHAYGIWWHENDGSHDNPRFTSHLIDSTFSQTHGLALADINQDGLPDLITGKRYFAHMGKDPGGLEPAVLKWLELKQDQDFQPSWIPHLIDEESGVGVDLVVQDMNGDAMLDIVIANKKGVFLFTRL